MVDRKKWPRMQEILDHAERGIIDDSTAGLTSLDFSDEEWDEVMADLFDWLVKSPNRARTLSILGPPERAALVEKLITAQSPDEIEAARHAAEAWLHDHPDDQAVLSACQYLTRVVTTGAVVQQPSGDRS